MKIRCLGILVCLLAAASLFAAGGNANLQPIAGSWKCTGIAFANEMGPEHPTQATVNTAWILNDKWLRVDYKEMKTAKNAHPVAAELLMTYNEAEKKIASGCIDNMGGYCTETSGTPPWDGDKLVLDGNSNMGGHAMKARETFTKGKGWIKHMGETEMNGKWVKTDEETCKK